MDKRLQKLKLRSRLGLALKSCEAGRPDEALIPDVIRWGRDMRATGYSVMPDFERVLPELPVISELSNGACGADAFLAPCIAQDILFSILIPDVSATLETESPPAIFKAIEDGDAEAIAALLETVDINARYGEFGETALYHAMSFSCEPLLPEIISRLLDAGADPQLGLTGCNALHGLGFAEITPTDIPALAEIIRRCVALGADLEQCSEKLQWTPLHCALADWNEAAAAALLAAGANPNPCAGHENRNCAELQSLWEIDSFQPRLVALLLKHGADPMLLSQQGKGIVDEVADSEFITNQQQPFALVTSWQRPN